MAIKKIIINALLFLITVVSLYIAILFLLSKIKVGNIPLVYRISDVINWKGGNTYKKFIDFNPMEKYDIIVLGSSHAYRGYDPRIFKENNIKIFNLGTSGQSIFNSYFIAKNYITASNCKLVILDIYDGALSSDGLESTADLIQNISSNKAATEMALSLKDPRFLNALTLRMLIRQAEPMYFDSSYITSGYSEKKDTIKKINLSHYNPNLKINNLQVAYLKKLLAYFTSRDIKVVSVSCPLPKETNKKNHIQFYNIVNSINSGFGIQYLDYSSSIHLDTRLDYYDSHHLNQSGVNKFDKILIDDLKEKGYFTWR